MNTLKNRYHKEKLSRKYNLLDVFYYKKIMYKKITINQKRRYNEKEIVLL